MKFGKTTHFGHLYHVDHKNSEFLKSRWRRAAMLIRHYSATVGWIDMKVGTVMHFDPLSLLVVKILNF